MTPRMLVRAAILSGLMSMLMHGCAPPEARSLSGRSLIPPTLPDDVQHARTQALGQARVILMVHPDDEDALIWVGRRLAYLGRYRDAIEIYTRGLTIHPDSYRLLRHRGHRHITRRQFDLAIADLELADTLSLTQPDTIEADGMPNDQGRPRSTTKGNIRYHLALARYLQCDFRQASVDFSRCLELASNDDSRVAAAYWVYLSAMRAGDAAVAASALEQATPVMDLIENHTYHTLLLAFQNLDGRPDLAATPASQLDRGVDDATLGYGLAMRDAFNGDADAARERLQQILDNTNWAAFGHIAAEADLARSNAVLVSDQP